MAKQYFCTSSARIELELERADALSGSQPGKDAADDIAYLRTVPYIAAQLARIAPDMLRAELKEYGAWDAAELADHDANLDRILWSACCDIRESEE